MGVPTDHERLFEKPYELEMFNIFSILIPPDYKNVFSAIMAPLLYDNF